MSIHTNIVKPSKRDLDLWKEMVEKAIDIKVKASLQSPFGIRKINSKYPKGYKPSVKKEKHKASW